MNRKKNNILQISSKKTAHKRYVFEYLTRLQLCLISRRLLCPIISLPSDGMQTSQPSIQTKNAIISINSNSLARSYLSCLSIYGSTDLCWALVPFSVSWSFYTICRTPWTGDQPVARPLPAHRTPQTQNKCTHTSMPWVGFESTIPVFERAKTVHALDRAATVISICGGYHRKI
jgi:hypothetical protein